MGFDLKQLQGTFVLKFALNLALLGCLPCLIFVNFKGNLIKSDLVAGNINNYIEIGSLLTDGFVCLCRQNMGISIKILVVHLRDI